mgnify:FL=1
MGDPRESYTLLSKKVLGGIALLVYTRDTTVTDRVVDVRVATAACGIFGRMGNKGAVGVRVTIEDGDSEKAPEGEDTGDTVLTFATAHLAAHDSGLERRNQDWRSIVERLVFAPDGPSEYYKPKRAKDVFAKLAKATALDAGGIQIYDTSYRELSNVRRFQRADSDFSPVFFFGYACLRPLEVVASTC